MTTSQERGPLVDDSEYAVRAVLTTTQWVPELDRPSTSLFDYKMFSVDLKSRTAPGETVARMVALGKKVYYLVEFNCGEARELGFETRDELDLDQPSNLAHCHVYTPKWDGGKLPRGLLMKMIGICTWTKVSE